jgi:hypothetical protein
MMPSSARAKPNRTGLQPRHTPRSRQQIPRGAGIQPPVGFCSSFSWERSCFQQLPFGNGHTTKTARRTPGKCPLLPVSRWFLCLACYHRSRYPSTRSMLPVQLQIQSKRSIPNKQEPHRTWLNQTQSLRLMPTWIPQTLLMPPPLTNSSRSRLIRPRCSRTNLNSACKASFSDPAIQPSLSMAKCCTRAMPLPEAPSPTFSSMPSLCNVVNPTSSSNCRAISTSLSTPPGMDPFLHLQTRMASPGAHRPQCLPAAQ